MPVHQEEKPHHESHPRPPTTPLRSIRRLHRHILMGLSALCTKALLFFTPAVWAQASGPNAPAAPSIAASVYQPSSSGGGMIWLTFITLLLLAGVVLLVAWLVHKNMTATVPNSSIKILSVQSLGPRERIVIASVVGRVYVLGHTANQISLIAELSPQEVAGLSASPAPIDFAARLSEILRKTKK